MPAARPVAVSPHQRLLAPAKAGESVFVRTPIRGKVGEPAALAHLPSPQTPVIELWIGIRSTAVRFLTTPPGARSAMRILAPGPTR